MFKPSKLRAYLLKARDAGLSPEAILEGSGTGWDEIESLTPMELGAMTDLFDHIARHTPRGFSVRSGRACKVREYGLVGFAMMSMPTLRAAFDVWNRYCLVAGHPHVTSVSESGDEWRMQFRTRRAMTTEAERLCAEASVAGLISVIEELTGSPAETTRIDFPFDRPATLESYELFGTTRFRFGGDYAVYHGMRSDLDRAIPARDDDISGVLRSQCDDLLAALSHDRPLLERLEDVMNMASGHLPSVDEVAGGMGMSVRSLQRELSMQGLNYREFVKQYRMRHATALLRDNRVNVKKTAYLLGFADVGSFRRAFHSWTGQSIGEWIRQHAASGEETEATLRRVA